MPGLTVLYDGACGFCRGSATRLRRLDTGKRIELLDLHDPAVVQRFAQIDREEALRSMQAVDGRGRVFSGVDAWARVGLTLPGWKWLAWILLVPGIHFVAARAYAWVARNRYRWNPEECADGSCVFHAGSSGSPPTRHTESEKIENRPS